MDAVWVTAILQGGAMIVLAYHFLVGLPALLARIDDSQRQERIFWANQNQQDRQAFADRASADRQAFAGRVELVAIELRRLTAEATRPRRDDPEST